MKKILLQLLFVGVALAVPESSRIFGGQPAALGQFPYQISLEADGTPFCGGSILSETIIISAAHCTSGRHDYSLQIRVGSVQSGKGGTVVKIKKIVDHPEWDPATIQNDISIIQLETPIVIDNKTTKVIKLADSKTKVQEGTPAIVSGFGLTSDGFSGRPSDVLLFASIPVLSQEACKKLYGIVIETMFCAGYTDSGIGAKSLDSGGPLVANGRLIGIVSFGSPKFAQVYTKVTAFRSWIDETIKNL